MVVLAALVEQAVLVATVQTVWPVSFREKAALMVGQAETVVLVELGERAALVGCLL